MQRPFVVLACGLQGFLFKGVIIYSIYSLESAVFFLNFSAAKLLQKSEMRKDIVIELSYKGFG